MSLHDLSHIFSLETRSLLIEPTPAAGNGVSPALDSAKGPVEEAAQSLEDKTLSSGTIPAPSTTPVPAISTTPAHSTSIPPPAISTFPAHSTSVSLPATSATPVRLTPTISTVPAHSTSVPPPNSTPAHSTSIPPPNSTPAHSGSILSQSPEESTLPTLQPVSRKRLRSPSNDDQAPNSIKGDTSGIQPPPKRSCTTGREWLGSYRGSREPDLHPHLQTTCACDDGYRHIPAGQAYNK
ncbi:hypothetical protein BDN72DRAFT_907175 [Pluteus cervinus]|uniref:Uncharacterized protein n=1 Tax=Pluteus cervinus TaxID=181527 RepID=A0ACD2ZXJ0_9AGAR|nr:hypothetical protein BDN72DRAFT_907175 [Pluteus cervinus]